MHFYFNKIRIIGSSVIKKNKVRNLMSQNQEGNLDRSIFIGDSKPMNKEFFIHRKESYSQDQTQEENIRLMQGLERQDTFQTPVLNIIEHPSTSVQFDL